STPTLLFSLNAPSHPPHLHSFPTRRSSDLPCRPISKVCRRGSGYNASAMPSPRGGVPSSTASLFACRRRPSRCSTPCAQHWRTRSEEHTSELQSQSNLVCRLLLEKKKI